MQIPFLSSRILPLLSLVGMIHAGTVPAADTQDGSIRPGAPARALPAGPAQARRFGAFYTRLSYDDAAWENVWRVGHHPDVLVTFDALPVRLVFWRGTSMIPCWVSENGVWYTNEFVEREAGCCGLQGCIEPMSDKQCRFSHARIIENTAARVVIHWRYSPVDLNYKQPFVDANTGWGDWVDEYYTIYPDGMGIRKIIHHTSALEAFTEYQESIVINPSGTFPEDNIRPEAVTLANLAGETSTWRWTPAAKPEKPTSPPNACIQRVNLKARFSPFVVFAKPVSFVPFGGSDSGRLFHFWNHWPVAQEKSSTTKAKSADKPSSTSVANVRDWPALEQAPTSSTRIMLHGMSDQPVEYLVKLARSWSNPSQCVVRGGQQQLVYDRSERAYVMANAAPQEAAMELTLQATPDLPVVNPAFIIRNWGESAPLLKIDSVAVPRGERFHFGQVATLEGTDLVCWIKMEATGPVNLQLSPERE